MVDHSRHIPYPRHCAASSGFLSCGVMCDDQEGFHWEVAANFQPLWRAVLASPGKTIKSYSLRSVTCHRVDDRVFYVKRYFHLSHALEPAKFFFKASAGRREWRFATPLAQLGIAVVPHCAYGERWSWRGLLESILITEGPAGFADLNEAEGTHEPAVQRALGRFVRQMHDAAVVHQDLQAANLLYSPTAQTFCLVDIERITLCRELSLAGQLDNLARLNRRFTLSLAFYEGYGNNFARHAAAVVQLSDASYRAAIPRYVRLSLKPGQTFVPWRSGGLNWQLRLPSLNENLERILSDPDRFLARDARLLKHGESSTVGASDRIVLKRSNPRKRRNHVIDLFRPSRARQAFLKARHLELLDIASPRPIATADRRHFGLAWCGYFVMEKIPEAKEIRAWTGDKREVVDAVARLLARMHQEGFTHRDLNERNLVFDVKGKPYLIDLDGLRFIKQTPDRRAARDLARLARAMLHLPRRHWDQGPKPVLSRTDRLWFLKAYCRLRGRDDWRWWWREVDRKLALRLPS